MFNPKKDLAKAGEIMRIEAVVYPTGSNDQLFCLAASKAFEEAHGKSWATSALSLMSVANLAIRVLDDFKQGRINKKLRNERLMKFVQEINTLPDKCKNVPSPGQA